MHLTSYLQDKRLTIALTGEIDHHCAKKYIGTIAYLSAGFVDSY